MGQFKPMVKMMTTEPTVELKLAKGGAVTMKKGGSTTKAKKMAMGGLGSMPAATMPSKMPAVMPAAMPAGPSPKKPSLASRRKAMMASRMPVRPMMKEGGESKAEHMAEMKKMAGTAKELKKHESMPASKAHKGLKTGGVAMGQGGYKDGGSVIPVSASKKGAEGYTETKMHTAKRDSSPAKTGGVKMGNGGGYKTGGVIKGNAGGYKKGGVPKKYADGGAVQDDGRAVKMPQGSKRPSTPVSINQLSGTFKKGGKVKKYAGGGDAEATAYDKFYEDEEKENRDTRDQFMRALKDPLGTIRKIPRKLGEAIDELRGKSGTVTKSKESVTVAPGKKRGGGC